MTANSQDIREYLLEKAPVNVTYSMAFEEQEARVLMGLTLAEYHALPGVPEWVDPDNPTLSKADVVAFYRLHSRIGVVQEDAAAKKAKRKR